MVPDDAIQKQEAIEDSMCLPTLSDIASKPLNRWCAAHRKGVQRQGGAKRNRQRRVFLPHLRLWKWTTGSNCRKCQVGRVNDLPRLKNRCLPKPIKAHVGGWMGATSMWTCQISGIALRLLSLVHRTNIRQLIDFVTLIGLQLQPCIDMGVFHGFSPMRCDMLWRLGWLKMISLQPLSHPRIDHLKYTQRIFWWILWKPVH